MITINRPVPCTFIKDGLIRNILETVIREEKKFDTHKTDITVNFVDNRTISKLNEKYRSKLGPTDILSFNIDEYEGARYFLGELYISIPVLKKQAPLYGNSVIRELVILLIHGCLHLHGYEHEMDATPRQIALMSKKETTYRKSLAPAGMK